MGRDVTASKGLLLDDADQNIGNSQTVVPQQSANPPPNVGTTQAQTNPPRIIILEGGSARGQTVSVVMTASRIIGGTADNPNPGLPGPITGIVEFGNGGRSTSVEFDVPIGPYTGTFASATSAQQPQDGGTIITVPTGVVRAYARYDNLFVTPRLGNNPPVSLAQLAGVPFSGPGGPIGPAQAEPVLVKAMAAYFTRARAKAYKTLHLYVSQMAPTAILVSRSFFCLPAFAKNVKVLRLPLTSSLFMELCDGCNIVDNVTIAAGSSAPTIELVGHESIVALSSVAPTDTVTYLALVCEVGI
ncbi:MAG TPA: hypothetical protein VMT45_02660 [Thermoanaerobaculaceae bacterium]|nr:hypothetical protein [Thermoanaerobaculaceae bacterium]